MPIHLIFGKKGGGKSTLSKALAQLYQNKIVFLSPVETLKRYDFEAFTLKDVFESVSVVKNGEIVLVANADIDAMEIVSGLAIERENFTIIIDEAERYAKSPGLQNLIHYSRHFTINLICNTRRYTDVTPLLRSQYDYFYCFKVTEPADLQYIQSIIGQDCITTVQNLQQFQYIQFPSKKVAFTPKNTYL